MTTTPLVGSSFPTKVIQVSGTNLFAVAAKELGDATQWDRIARLNGLVDPWLVGIVELKIPKPGLSNGGILYGA